MYRATIIAISTFLIFTTKTAASDVSWERPDVITETGIVKFVHPDITPAELANLIFPENSSTKTRSVFSDPATKPAYTVAMLISFEFDSANLTTTSKRQLSNIGSMLKTRETNHQRLTIEGHTDIVGTEKYNLSLSFKRAEAVKTYLVKEHLVDANRLDIVGKGETTLIDVSDPKGSINRRVQFSAANYYKWPLESGPYCYSYYLCL